MPGSMRATLSRKARRTRHLRPPVRYNGWNCTSERRFSCWKYESEDRQLSNSLPLSRYLTWTKGVYGPRSKTCVHFSWARVSGSLGSSILLLSRFAVETWSERMAGAAMGHRRRRASRPPCTAPRREQRVSKCQLTGHGCNPMVSHRSGCRRSAEADAT
jgi:hypothetical protein